VASVLLHNQIERLEADGGRGPESVMAALNAVKQAGGK
jgi:hypothetical protein